MEMSGTSNLNLQSILKFYFKNKNNLLLSRGTFSNKRLSFSILRVLKKESS